MVLCPRVKLGVRSASCGVMVVGCCCALTSQISLASLANASCMFVFFFALTSTNSISCRSAYLCNNIISNHVQSTLYVIDIDKFKYKINDVCCYSILLPVGGRLQPGGRTYSPLITSLPLDNRCKLKTEHLWVIIKYLSPSNYLPIWFFYCIHPDSLDIRERSWFCDIKHEDYPIRLPVVHC